MNKIHSKINHINVNLGQRAYQIFVGQSLIENTFSFIDPILNPSKTIIITDENVSSKWLAPLEANLKTPLNQVETIVLPTGEQTKSFAHLERLINNILALKIDRQTLLIALGGGVIGDLVGFASSIILRGLDFIQIPTTLLAQVDSSIGGKTAINTQFGKNLVGSFFQPRLVLADIKTLQTLPKRELLAGYAEVVKHGLISNLKFFEWCELNGNNILAANPNALKAAIIKSCEIKSEIIANDEKEHGQRAILNLGHTFGHAIEAESGYTAEILHGEAVSIGIILAFKLSNLLNLCSAQEVNRVEKHFAAVGLPTNLSKIAKPSWTAEKLIAHMKRDKKVLNGNITFILAKGIGKPFISKSIKLSDVEALLNSELKTND